MRIALTLSYDGACFCGWQRQKNGVSVQETLETALSSLLGEEIKVCGSGRTDAGVHALGQVAHFDTDTTIPPEKFYKALNPLLPSGVKVLSSKLVDKTFNACRTAKRKTYSYSFYFSDVEIPVLDKYALAVNPVPDFSVIDKAISLLVGEHDFKAFCASGSSVKTTVRTIYEISVIKTPNGFNLEFTGNGFLYNMVRIMSGAILEAGQGYKSLEDIGLALKTGKRDLLGKTLPPKALCLKSVEY